MAWYGDADLIPHFIGVLASGAIDVTVSWGEAIAYDMSADRKQIARDAEAAVRRMTSAALRAGAATERRAIGTAGLAATGLTPAARVAPPSPCRAHDLHGTMRAHRIAQD